MMPRYEFGGLPENSLIRLGAERERQRIRRAQRGALFEVETFSGWNQDRVKEAVAQLDAATRAPRKKGRK